MAKKKTEAAAVNVPVLQIIELGLIRTSALNPRKEFDESELQELAESIKKVGVIQPITVRSHSEGGYELVCGERRYRASLVAGLVEVPASIRELTDSEAMELMVTENLQRKDVSPLEEADAFQFMIDNMKYEIADVAARIAKNESFVIRRLQLLKLIPQLKEAFKQNIISIGHIDLLSRIAVSDQEYWVHNVMGSWNGPGTIKDLKQHLNSKAERKLLNAKFDRSIPFAGTIACIECPANSSCNNTLFPDKQDEAICHNSTCYSLKSLKQFEIDLAAAIDDPYTLLINTQYGDTPAIVKKLSSEGYVILKEYDDYNSTRISEPKEPMLSDLDADDYDSEEDRINAFNEELKEYQDDKNEYDDLMIKITTGEDDRRRAFVVAGHDAGNYKIITLKSAKAVINSFGGNEEAKKSEQKSQLNQKITRGRELDDEKVYEKVKPLIFDLPLLKKVDDNNMILSAVESSGLIALAYQTLSWSCVAKEEIRIKLGLLGSANGSEILEAISKAPLEVRSFIVRWAILSAFSGNTVNSLGGQVVLSLANHWMTDEYDKIRADQDLIKKKREDRLNERIAELDK